MEDRLAAGIPGYIRELMLVLEQAGYRAHPVGGCVRDLLLGREPNDFDMTTNARPEEMLRVFSTYRVIPTGLQHGTVTVLAEGHPVEITTYRTDGAYTDGRHPDTVAFTESLEEDLARRDFTVNAMAYHPDTGLIDPFGGQRDLTNGVIRAVGDPRRRFSEDALRILRCFRFAAKLEFQIESETADAAAALADRLSQIAVERIFTELCKLLEAPGAVYGMTALTESGALPYVLPGITDSSLPLSKLALLPPDAALRLSLLLAHEQPAAARQLCRRLHTPNAFADRVAGYLEALADTPPTDAFTARRFVCTHFGMEEGAMHLRHALTGVPVEEPLSLLRQVRRDRTAVELRRLAINGRELQEALGVPPAATGRLLRQLQELVWEEPGRNRRETLMAAAAKLLQKENENV